MTRALTPCSEPGCPVLVERGRCPDHQRTVDRARGTRQQRGYDRAHERERRRWTRWVAAGVVCCARCDQPIAPGEAWDLGHRDDRDGWTGPEHAACNRAHHPGGNGLAGTQEDRQVRPKKVGRLQTLGVNGEVQR